DIPNHKFWCPPPKPPLLQGERVNRKSPIVNPKALSPPFAPLSSCPMQKIDVVSALFVWTLFASTFRVIGAEEVTPSAPTPRIAPASAEGEEAIKRFRLP